MWLVFAVLAALTAGIVVVLSKAGMKDVDPILAFAIQAVLILIVSGSAVLIQGKYGEVMKIDTRTWLFLGAAGVITAVSSLLSFKALKLGEAASVSPITSLSLVFAIILAIVFLKEKITWQLIVGATLMAIGAIVIAIARKAS